MQLIDREKKINRSSILHSFYANAMKRIYFEKQFKAGEEGLLNRMQLIDTEDLT